MAKPLIQLALDSLDLESAVVTAKMRLILSILLKSAPFLPLQKECAQSVHCAPCTQITF